MREADAAERRAVLMSLDAVQSGLSSMFLGGRVLVVWDEDGVRQVGLATKGAVALPPALRADAFAWRVGALDEDGFAIGLQGAVEWARRADIRTVRVNEKASRLFIYHRDILGPSVLRADPALRPDDTCIVCNPRGEALGLGTVVSFKGTGVAVRPQHDLGAYLRDQD